MTRSDSPIDPISPISPEAITDRQREVARLVAGGRTNTEIADELGITLDGAKYHVSELLTRLGLRRREEVGEWYRAHFGPVARLRTAVRGMFGPVPALLGGLGVAVLVFGVSAMLFVGLRGASDQASTPPEVATPTTPVATEPVEPRPGAGAFERLLYLVPRGHLQDLMMGDLDAWRDLVGSDAPVTYEAQGADELSALATQYGVHPFFSVNTNGWYLGIGGDPFGLTGPQGASIIPARTEEIFGFGPDDVGAYAFDLWSGIENKWGVLLGSFDRSRATTGLTQCAGCLDEQATTVGGATIWDWSHWNTADGNENLARAFAAPLFDRFGLGGALVVESDRVLSAANPQLASEFVEGPFLAQDDAVRETAAYLDGLGLLYVQFAIQTGENVEYGQSTMGLDTRFTDGTLPTLDPYQVRVTGGGYDEDAAEPFTVILIPFADETEAAANVGRVEDRLAALDPEALIGEPGLDLEGWGVHTWGDFLADVEVTANGRFLVVRSEGIGGYGRTFYGGIESLFWAGSPPQPQP